MKSRNGKIARMPHDVREELNQRLERSERSPQSSAWLDADNGEDSSPVPSQSVAVSRSDKIVEKAGPSADAAFPGQGAGVPDRFARSGILKNSSDKLQ
jgi:hypothetical protein